MKISKIILIALAGVGIVCGAKAQTITTNAGDLILSFRVNDGVDISGGIAGNNTKNLEVDLGAVSNFLSNNYTFNLGPDLSALFGSSWSSATDLVWSAASSIGTSGSNALWATSPGNQAAFARQSASLQNTVRTNIDGVRIGLGGQTATGLGLNAAVVDWTSLSQSYTTEVTKSSTSYYGYTKFSSGIENGVSGTGAVTSDLYYVPSGSGSGTDWGTFSLGSDGTLAYTAAVPEPSSYASFGIGAGLILMTFGRRRKVQPVVT